ncbi:FadR/GntR family transcriptional regulator [Oceanispirochaeta crateris]|nr:FadR/GntR family transcriptional regulator [Oceanispirochaeta crateris]
MMSINGKYNRLSDVVVDKIKVLVCNGTLSPGDQLPSELKLIEMFDVSRTTIREAINRLVEQNIVEIIRGKGTYVAITPGVQKDPFGFEFIDPDLLFSSLIDARVGLESGVAKMAAENALESDIIKISQNNVDLRSEIQDHHVRIGSEIDFHLAIATATHNDVIIRVVPIILNSIFVIYRERVPTESDHWSALEEHEEILNAIKKRDSDRAYTAMYTHLVNSKMRILNRNITENQE